MFYLPVMVVPLIWPLLPNAHSIKIKNVFKIVNFVLKINKIKHSKNSKENVYYGLEVGNNHEQDGRVIIAEFKEFLLVNTYVPNAGMKLENLSFRYCFVNNGSFRCRVLIIDVCVFYRGEWDQKLSLIHI